MKTLSRYVRLGAAPAVSLVAYKATADIVSKAATLAITVVAARVLPPMDFGVLALAMTTGWILGVASDAGLPLFLAKQIARDVATREPLSFAAVSRVMRMRAAFGTCAAVAGIIIAFAVVPEATAAAFIVIVVAQLLSATLETLSHAYRGLGRSDIESGLMLVQRGLTLGSALAVLVWQPSLLWLSLALAIPPGGALLVSLRIASRIFSDESSAASTAPSTELSTPHSAQRTPHFSDIAPIGAGILLSAVYFRCDVYFIEQWHGLEAVGLYNAAFRIVEALRLFPAAVLAVGFPLLCRAQDLRPLWRLALGLAAGGALLLGVLYPTSSAILQFVYGASFAEAAPALRILALALPLFFVNYALTHQVIGWDGQRSYLVVCAAALVTNLTVNALLIPAHGMMGAATSTVITELIVLCGCVTSLRCTAKVPALAGTLRLADVRSGQALRLSRAGAGQETADSR